MKDVTKTRLRMGAFILFLSTVGAVGILAAQLAKVNREKSIAEANLRAKSDTVRIYEARDSSQTMAANLFQLQQEIDSDSIAELETALGVATRDLDIEHMVLTEATIEIDRLQKSLDTAMTELTNVLNPVGRPERIAVYQFDTTFVQTDVVVVVPWDTSQSIEVELVTIYKPIDIGYSLGCTPEKDAVATFEFPAGMMITPHLGQVDDEICHPKSPFFTMDFNLGSLIYGGVGFGLGFGSGWYLGQNSASSEVNINIDEHLRMYQQKDVRFNLLTVKF